jgi:hypothetical protein
MRSSTVKPIKKGIFVFIVCKAVLTAAICAVVAVIFSLLFVKFDIIIDLRN